MHFIRTLDPPDGAAAPIAVIGGEDEHNAGYFFIVFGVVR